MTYFSEATQPVSILLVDDRPENLLALEATLETLGQNLVQARSGEEALRHLLHRDFAVILLDVQMPGIDGFETATLIRERERSRQIPIIFLTAFSISDQFVFRGYSLGAVDYLLKPIDPGILLSKVRVFVELYRKNAEIERQAARLAAVNSQLAKSEERLQDFLDHAKDLIEIISPEGRLTYVNRAWQDTLGYDGSALDRIGSLEVIHPDDRERFAAAMEMAKRSRGNQELETVFVTASGREVSVEGSLNCRFEGGRPQEIRCIFHDITERKQAEQARSQVLYEQVARQQAEAASLMKDEFLAMVSHELRTPLNAMLGWSRLLRTRQMDEQTNSRALEAIERNARLQAQLIEDLLDISRIVTGKLHLELEPIQPIDAINAAIDALRFAAETKAISFETEFGPGTGPFLLDTNRLQQIVWNLLSNAVKFTPVGGRVGVRLRRSGDHLELQVSDNGVGIDPEFLPYIFDRFRQADSSTTRSHSGLGLGLSIVRHLVELHGGTVHAYSAGENLGTSFVVELPAVDPPIQEPPVDNGSLAESPAGGPLAGLRILLVEDETDAREFIALTLRQMGVEVTASASAAEALSALEQDTFAVIVSDIGMPGEDGYTFIRRVRQQGYGTPAIALTAYTRREDRLKALKAGFQRHLPKPVEPGELSAVIASLAVEHSNC